MDKRPLCELPSDARVGPRRLDGFVFTAGIGENLPMMRARIARHLAWLRADLDPAADARGPLISRPDSCVPVGPNARVSETGRPRSAGEQSL
jgi:hypothetical protein